MQKIASTVVIVVLIWALRFGYNVITASDDLGSYEDDGAWIAEENQWIEEEVATGSAQRARGWLAAPKHGTFEGNPKQMDALIERFHSAGASEVWMVGIESFGGAELSDTISVELPTDPQARARIFAVETELYGEAYTPDVGQRYLTISFD